MDFSKKTNRILVSACLLGVRCRYDGRSAGSAPLLERLPGRCIIPICPEQLGGLSTPRPPAVMEGGDGWDVLHGRARVVDETGRDVSEAFVRGAWEALRIARLFEVGRAVLKARSPSCGLCTPYCDKTGGGMGVTASLLSSEGLEVKEAQ